MSFAVIDLSNGVTYPSQAECARALGITKAMACRYIAKKKMIRGKHLLVHEHELRNQEC